MLKMVCKKSSDGETTWKILNNDVNLGSRTAGAPSGDAIATIYAIFQLFSKSNLLLNHTSLLAQSEVSEGQLVAVFHKYQLYA
jgi:hypothetical protein